ncbi:MAG: family 43 glycosylhydrolase [Butyrivibrio sp.]|uniref:family 43 glycosylhydrolase n=1 Tax=Butyrivibrio sp. TaxID=28121 RepID=UPI0025E94BF5|nr:family 43 glycosylhydrolase [Butyrivibrio sp.]MCR5770396.1 family 43 glycosylhydrolase [Butyrivibrio sp.]
MINKLINGDIWKDTCGNTIHAHGGHILFFQGVYYWYGENRTGNRYVSVYSSTDLMNWDFRNDVLTTESKTEKYRVKTDTSLVTDDGSKINIERPKVIYNEKTKKFVMWMHVENGRDYSLAACAVAVSDTPCGQFTYLGSFNPFGYMSRDCTLFVDDDKTAYFISASRENADLHMYRLTDDYLNVDSLVNNLWQGEYREAPAVVKHNDKYYMFSSYCTGWAPNQCKYAVADKMDGRWSVLTEIGDETTYRTQPAFFLTVEDSGNIYYFSDRWNGKDYNDSRYVVLPLEFDDEGKPILEYKDEVEIR